ncbi:MAG: DUF1684 domain-containing protein [Flavobacteriales bacterium]
MKNKLTLIILLISTLSFSQKNLEEITKENQEYRAELNAQYKDSLHSPLKKEARDQFTAFPFYDIDTNYYVISEFKKVENSEVFGMKTSTKRKPKYKIYGTVTFTINDSVYTLNVYQNITLVKRSGYEDYLFLPFNDYTNGNETYGGGRYLDVRIPEGNTMILDFNKAYNPYCAYTYGYSCPVPPRENGLKAEIRAGIKYVQKED